MNEGQSIFSQLMDFLPVKAFRRCVHGATTVVLSKGIYERLQVCSETLRRLKDQGITAHVLQTEKAVELYNQLREKEKVGGLFHST